jgi:enoyl-CoA hydratase/carnithine racemase
MSSPAIRLDVAGEIGELILDKPAKRNALSTDMWQAIPDLIRIAVDNKSVKVIIIHGGSTGAFASGADISEFETIYATPEMAAQSSDTIARAIESVASCAKPVLAAIDGACVGGGVSLALAADLRIASAGAKFAVTPGKLGLVYSVEDTRRLAQAVGVPNAKDILLTGRILECEEAFRMGLVNRLAPKGEALAITLEVAKNIGAISQWSNRATKQMFEGALAGWDNTTPQAKALFLDGFTNEDFVEGIGAFLEKRPANFTFR